MSFGFTRTRRHTTLLNIFVADSKQPVVLKIFNQLVTDRLVTWQLYEETYFKKALFRYLQVITAGRTERTRSSYSSMSSSFQNSSKCSPTSNVKF